MSALPESVRDLFAGPNYAHVATVLPLDRAADGLAAIAAGLAHGKIVATMGD